jgi:hypothetical protein
VPADGLPEQFRGAGQIQLLFDPRAVGLDGLEADVEGFSDLPRRAPLSEHLEHLQLAVAELLDGRLGGKRFTLDKLGCHCGQPLGRYGKGA